VFRLRPLIAACFEINLLTGLMIVAAIACPWYIAVETATGGTWWKGFLVDHHFGPAVQVKDEQNGFPFYPLYPLVMLHLGCFPWSVFLPVAGYRLWERLVDGAPWRESDRLLSCWIGVWIMVFSLFSTKLPNSLLPIFPATALILARYFNDWKRAKVDFGVYSFNLCCRAMWISGGFMALGLSIASYLYFPSEQWIGLIGLVPVVAAFVAMKLLEWEKRPDVLRTLVVAALVLAVLSVVVMPMTIRPYQDSPVFIAEARQMAKSSDIVIGTYDYFEPSVLFYAGRKVSRLESSRKVADFIASHPHAFVITKEKKVNDLRADLSGGTGQLSRHRNFMSGRELVLVGRY